MGKIRKKYKILALVVVLVAATALPWWYLTRHSIDVLQPRGPVAHKERGLIILSAVLAAIVVLPTFGLTIYIAWKYNEKNHNKHTKYTPDFDHSRLFESIWWGVPIVIIGILSVVAWNSSHSLDPFRSLASDKKPVTVQVVSLDWKWLFIYPEQHVASVNMAVIPVGTPVDFNVTSDTIMNSFWVPSLGGQIYSMPGMVTQLHQIADKPGDYFGSPANIAGKGFSRMDFTVRALSQDGYSAWLSKAASSPRQLNFAGYEKLAKPSDNNPVVTYSSVPSDLFSDIVMQYMTPGMSLKSMAAEASRSAQTAHSYASGDATLQTAQNGVAQ